MTRVAILLVLPSLLWCASAVAQVAAPSLVPASPGLGGVGFVTLNPAVMQWGAPSRIGAGFFQADEEDTDATTGATTSRTDFDGPFAGLRWVGERLSFAAETLQTEGSAINGLPLEVDLTGAAVAFQVGGVAAFGGGQTVLNSVLEGPAPPIRLDREFTTNLAGVSLRLGEVFFLGAAGGTLKLAQTSTQFPTFADGTAERNVRRFGVGFRNSGEVVWHLEYFVGQGEFAQNAAANITLEEEDTQVAVIEARFGNWVLGLVVRDSEETDKAAVPEATATTEAHRASLGWVPMDGLGIFAQYSRAEKDDPANNQMTESTSASLGLVYQF